MSPRNDTAIDNVGRVDHLRVVVALDPYLSLQQLAGYSSLSVRKLRELLKDPFHPLSHYRIPGRGGTGETGKILVRRSEFDAWMGRYRAAQTQDLNKLTDDLLRELGVTHRS